MRRNHVEGPDARRHETRMTGLTRWTVLTLGGLGLAIAINQTFMLKILGFQPLGNGFLYYIVGIFLAASFLIYPARGSDPSSAAPMPAASLIHPAHGSDQDHVPWYDWVLVTATLGSSGYLGYHALLIRQQGWEYSAPFEAMVASSIILVAALEGVRRCGGTSVLVVALIFGSYPLYAAHMPGFLWGNAFDLSATIRAHVLGVESIIGIPMQVVARLVIGFVLFGAVLTSVGGGKFFMTLATALMGRSRGGPAKVAVVSSGFMGSLSGSVISNVLTTGAITIPTMKRAGYPPHYAAAVEACASTGGALMPPIMGAVAFIMASFLGVPYREVMIAATLPALLFYAAMVFQVDVYAARNGLKGLPREEIPALGPTLAEGWPYFLSLAVLIYILLFLRLDSQAPYYATVVLVVVSLLRERKEFFRGGRVALLLLDVTRSIAQLVGVLAGIGLVVGGLAYTGVAGSFSRELLLYAGDNVALMLIAGALTSFILGMGMTTSACYIFLSILLAPALIGAGLNEFGSHLFILYWGMMSNITPPVALAAITAASISGASASLTGWHAVRLGGVLFILPFIFVLQPALILQGPVGEIMFATVSALVAIWAFASASEGYLYRAGSIGVSTRLLLLISSAGLVYPEFASDALGLGLILLLYLAHYVKKWLSIRSTRAEKVVSKAE